MIKKGHDQKEIPTQKTEQEKHKLTFRYLY